MQLRVGPLVRAVSADSVVLWAELRQRQEVTICAKASNSTGATTFATAHTVNVGDRHFVALPLTGLQPATWYEYSLQIAGIEIEQAVAHQCFRTLENLPTSSPLHLAYGSCRTAANPRRDVLSAFAKWLLRHYDEREMVWPHLLLLIGDQVYADEPSRAAQRWNPELRGGSQRFAQFASLYEWAWTHDPNVRQLLATLPTYMICDDHEIFNNWNTTPSWRESMLQNGQEQRLVDGLVAYWIYQAWGNLLPQAADTRGDLRLAIMHDYAATGEDALEALRNCMRRTVYDEARFRWHYSIPTSPPIFVCDARIERENRFSWQSEKRGIEAPAHIMRHEQMTALQNWMQENDNQVSLVVSSVPVILPPLIGGMEHLMGRRFSHAVFPFGRKIARRVGQVQQNLAERLQFDHWPLYNQTWQEMVELLAARRHDVVVLSGDVHFSYVADAKLAVRGAKNGKAPACLRQWVCSPFENQLGTKSRHRIIAQARIKQMTYGGLQTRMQPLQSTLKVANRNPSLLMGNMIALAKWQPAGDGTFRVEQKYFGWHNGKFQEIARYQTKLQ